jgi:hypothetical protein
VPSDRVSRKLFASIFLLAETPNKVSQKAAKRIGVCKRVHGDSQLLVIGGIVFAQRQHADRRGLRHPMANLLKRPRRVWSG